MFEVVFLGTSAAAPSFHRNLTGHVILAGDRRFLLDCGEGTQQQILRSGIGFKRINCVLLTHSHLDHILGLGGLVSTLSRWEGLEYLELYGSRQTLDRVERLLLGVVLNAAKSPIDIRFIDIAAGVIWENDKFQVSAFPTVHRGPGCFGYCFQERDYRPFLVNNADALGIPANSDRRKLVLGETIVLADGRRITPDDVLGPSEPGSKLVFGGDGISGDSLRQAAERADLLVSEATFLESEATEAKHYGHTTAQKAAQLAKDAGCKNLILTHISRRYRERDILAEAGAIFPGVRLARDLDHYALKRGGKLTRKRNLIERG